MLLCGFRTTTWPKVLWLAVWRDWMFLLHIFLQISDCTFFIWINWSRCFGLHDERISLLLFSLWWYCVLPSSRPSRVLHYWDLGQALVFKENSPCYLATPQLWTHCPQCLTAPLKGEDIYFPKSRCVALHENSNPVSHGAVFVCSFSGQSAIYPLILLC